ncbi:hypothetical protein BGX29_001062 [Mortierella sp. GBA35]|nr:hypothetical protein BGX29_001062 [Mortierella sp. GBA35]
MTGSSQEQIPDDAKGMHRNMHKPMAHPPTATRPPGSGAATGYSMPPVVVGGSLAAVVAAVAKTALAPVITVSSTIDVLRPAQVNLTPTSTTSATTTTATSTTAVTATATATTPSSTTISTPTRPNTTPSNSNSSTTTSSVSTIRLTSMTVGQSQWDHSPGGFPESYGHANYAYSTTGSQGYDSTVNSKQNSLDYTRDDNFSHISFLYANEKRFGDFHSLFRSVPDDEKLIEDYGCALQKEILVQGRLYISENHVCFHANIFGWVTTLVIAFSEITAIEKRLTAFVIPNAISIVTTTNTKGHFFASFLSRDAAHDLLMAAWRKSFPCAANASVSNSGYSNGSSRQSRATLLNDDDDNTDAMSFISGRGNPESRRNRHRRSFSNASQSATGDEGTGREDGSYWGGEDGADTKSLGNGNNSLRRRGSRKAVLRKVFKDVIAPIIPDENNNNNGNGNNGSLSLDSIPQKTGRGRSVSELPPRPTSFDGAGSRGSSIDTARSSFDYESLSPPLQLQRARAGTESLPNRRNATIPPPSLIVPTISTTPSLSTQQQQHQQRQSSTKAVSRSPTICKCSKDNRHYANTYMSDTFPGTIESIWKVFFDSDFSKNFLTSDVMKGADVQEEPWQNAPDGTTTRVTRYTRWLGLPIGPKTTKAIVTDLCEHKDFDDYVTTVTTTSTPDVPSGGSFTTKIRTCMTWAGPNQVLVVVTGAVEFTKSSWIKGQIEKGAAEGLTFHYKEVNPCIRKHIAAHPEEFSAGRNGGLSSVLAGQATAQSAMSTPFAPSVETNGGGNKVRNSGSSDEGSRVQPTSINTNKSTETISGSSSLSSPSLFSKLAKTLSKESGSINTTSNKSDGETDGTVSYWVLLTVMAIVMAANVYIWLQISNVSQQIERIQNDILSVDQDQHYHRHHNQQHRWKSEAEEEMLDDFEREELFARGQEDAMWAWLTEREARHQRYRQATGVFSESRAKFELTRRQQLLREQERQQQGQEQQQPTAKSSLSELTETELKLQARIDELQAQLIALDRQASDIKIDSHHIEQDLSFSSSPLC